MAYADLVPTFDLSNELDAHGWSVETQYYWFNTGTALGQVVVNFGQPTPQIQGFTHAPQASDFPALPSGYAIVQESDGYWWAQQDGVNLYYGNTGVPVKEPREIDCQAATWLYFQG